MSRDSDRAEPSPDDPELAVSCPRCAAPPGSMCRTAERVPRRPHRRRRQAYALASAASPDETTI